MNNRNFGPSRRPLTARERSIRFRYGSLLVIAGLCSITLGFLYNKQNVELDSKTADIKAMRNKLDSSNHIIDSLKNIDLRKRSDSLQLVADSLYNENFPCQVELGRYQNAYEIFLRRNRKAANQYGNIISEETE